MDTTLLRERIEKLDRLKIRSKLRAEAWLLADDRFLRAQGLDTFETLSKAQVREITSYRESVHESLSNALGYASGLTWTGTRSHRIFSVFRNLRETLVGQALRLVVVLPLSVWFNARR